MKKVVLGAFLAVFSAQTAHAGLKSTQYKPSRITCETKSGFQTSYGTAVRLDNGVYITAYHSISQCRSVQKGKYNMHVYGVDEKNDIAIITTRRNALKAEIACDAIEDGEWLTFEGYPVEDGRDITYGVGTADTHADGWQIANTDDPMEVGISGGPVVSVKTGELRGIIHGRSKNRPQRAMVIPAPAICNLLKRKRIM